jgi:glyoxylase-like metal-dependent hydrolase (beta-lactamase superfamily II)
VGTWQAGEWTITRVDDPGFELVLPQDDATRSVLEQSPWLAPAYVTEDWSLRVGSAALLLTGPGPRILVDPWLAFDDPARHEGRLGALHDAGVDAADIDIVVNSHADGIGTNVGLDGVTPTFPNARYLLPRAEIDALPAFAGLHAGGVLEPIDEPGPIAPGVELVDLPGHNPGHVGVEVGGAAVIVGHLFLHPAQVANPAVTTGDHDPATLTRTREALLARAAAEDVILVGPLWAAPGGGHVARDGDRYRLT